MKKLFFSSESFKKGYLRSSGLNIISKFVAFFNTLLIAYFFGTTTSTDFYFFCIGLVTTVSAFLTALDISILIPESMRIKAQQSEPELQRFLTTFLFLAAALCVVVSLMVLINPQSSFILISKFTKEVLNANLLIVYLSMPLLLLITVNTFLTDILISYKFFSVSVLSGLLNSVLSILIIVVFHSSLHILSILLSLLIANLIQLFINVVLMKSRLGWTFCPSVKGIKRKIITDSIVAQAGNFTTLLSTYVPLWLISSFSSGVLSSVSYASRIPDFIALFVTTQFGTVTGIKFNELYAQKRTDEIRRVYVEASAFLQFVLVPICILVFIFSEDIVAVLFGHGAFNRTSVANTGELMKYFVLILPFTAHNTLVARLFMAAQKIKNSFIFQMVMNGIMVIVVYALIKMVGPKGLPIGVLATYVLICITSDIIMKKNFDFIPYKKTLVYSLKCLLINSPVFLIVAVLNRVIDLHSLWYMGAVAIFYGLVLVMLNHIFKVNTTISEAVTIALRIGKMHSKE
jgi:peptidoglycan biosynthesis protein MviN/MurJ (putative lipid II flippase)